MTLGFEFSSTSAGGAFLIPGGQTRRVARYLMENKLIEYLLENYSLILDKYSDYPLEECSLVILKETTRVSGWCRGLATRTARGIAGYISVNIPAIGVPILSLDVEYQYAALQHVCSFSKVATNIQSDASSQWLIDSGPAENSAETDSTTSDYCIIIKPVVVRLRDRVKYRMKAILATRSSSPSPQKNTGQGSARPLHPKVCVYEPRISCCADRSTFHLHSLTKVEALLGLRLPAIQRKVRTIVRRVNLRLIRNLLLARCGLYREYRFSPRL